MRTAPAMSAAGQSLEMKPDGARGLGGVGADAARAGDQQDVQARREREQLLADLRARLLADEQVHERDVRVVAARERERLLACCARSGSAPPTAARRASAAGPSARPRGRRRRARAACGRSSPAAIRDGLRSGPVNRHRQSHAPASRARARRTRRSRRPAAPRAPRAAGPCRVWRGRPRTPSLITSSTSVSPSLMLQATSTLRRPRVLVRVADGLGEHRLRERLELARDLRRARSRGAASRSQVAVLAAQPLDLLQQRRVRLRRAAARAGAAARAAGRTARPAAPRRCARAPPG